MSVSPLKIGSLQPTQRVSNNTDLDQKKPNESQNRTRDIAIGAVAGAVIVATAAYLGRDAIFGSKPTPTDYASKVCEFNYLIDNGANKAFSTEGGVTKIKVDVAPESKFSKAYSTYLASKEYQECADKTRKNDGSSAYNDPCRQTTLDVAKAGEYSKAQDAYKQCKEDMKKAPQEFFSKFCEVNPSQWVCA